MNKLQKAASLLALTAGLCGALNGCSHSRGQEDAQVKAQWEAHREPPPGFAEKMAARQRQAQQGSEPGAVKK